MKNQNKICIHLEVPIAKLQIEPNEKPLIGESGRHYIHVLVCHRLQRMAVTYVTLAFGDGWNCWKWLEMAENSWSG